MQYTPEEIQAALTQHYGVQPAGLGMTPAPVAPVAAPDWRAAAAQYAQPVVAGPAVTSVPPAASLPPPEQESGAPMDLPPVVITPAAAPSSPKEALDAYARSTADQAYAVRQRGEETARALETESQLADQQKQELETREKQYADEREAHDSHAQELFASAQKLNTEANNMRVVDRRTTGQVVTGAIATALASIGDGFNRMGGNTQTDSAGQVQRILNERIERDLQLQREAIDDKRKSAGAKFTEYGLARQMGLDSQDTEEFARTLIMKKQAAAAKALAGNTQAVDARALAEQTAAGLEAAASEKQSEILDRNARTRAYETMARRQGGGGGGTVKPPKAAQMTREQLESIPAGQRTAEQQAALKSFGKNGTEGGPVEIIPGFYQDENVQPLTQGEVNDVRKQYRSARGVQYLTDELAKLWTTAVDPATPDDARTEARTKYASYMNDLQAGKSVQTGQGTVTEGDAKRLAESGAYPELPTNWLGAATTVRNFVKDKDPGAASIREIGNAALGKIEAELADGYGIRRREQPAPQPSRGKTSPQPAPSVMRATSAKDLD